MRESQQKMHDLKIRVTCPYCDNHERTTISGPIALFKKLPGTLKFVLTDQTLEAEKMVCHTYCPNCANVFGVVIADNGRNHRCQKLLERSSSVDSTDVLLQDMQIFTQPKSTSTQTILGLPEEITQPFHDLQEDVKKKRNAAGVMSISRGCLDVCLKEQGYAEGDRRSRIQKLLEDGKITIGLAEWANNLWSEGSDAVHDLKATTEQAAEHVEWLKLFLQVVYELPEQIRISNAEPPEEHS